jgi:hypothetical protein
LAASAPERSPVPAGVDDEWNGVTVCMHLRDYQATTASMVAELPADPDALLRAWVALGSPCASVYIPVFPAGLVPPELARPETWSRFAALRDRVEAAPDALAPVRERLAGVEAALWDRADEAAAARTDTALEEYAATAWAPVDAALAALGV